MVKYLGRPGRAPQYRTTETPSPRPTVADPAPETDYTIATPAGEVIAEVTKTDLTDTPRTAPPTVPSADAPKRVIDRDNVIRLSTLDPTQICFGPDQPLLSQHQGTLFTFPRYLTVTRDATQNAAEILLDSNVFRIPVYARDDRARLRTVVIDLLLGAVYTANGFALNLASSYSVSLEAMPKGKDNPLDPAAWPRYIAFAPDDWTRFKKELRTQNTYTSIVIRFTSPNEGTAELHPVWTATRMFHTSQPTATAPVTVLHYHFDPCTVLNTTIPRDRPADQDPAPDVMVDYRFINDSIAWLKNYKKPIHLHAPYDDTSASLIVVPKHRSWDMPTRLHHELPKAPKDTLPQRAACLIMPLLKSRSQEDE